MCGTCGCGGDATVTNPDTGTHTHVLADGRVIEHAHGGSSGSAHDHAHAPAPPVASLEVLEARVLASNERLAERNRAWLDARELLAINLMSAPGAGKTSLLVATLQALDADCTVIEGDQETLHDAERIRATGTPAVQVNTGTGCHLEADMVWRGLQELRPKPGGVLFVENVGNLVCPSMFDLGEAARVVLFSVTEGEDKPRKYPHIFRRADLVLLTKTDLLPHLDFDVGRAAENLRAVHPDVPLLHVSTKSRQGLDAWLAWIAEARERART